MATAPSISDRPLTLTGRWRAAARVAALGLPLVTCAALAAFRDQVTSATAALVLVLWVVAAAATGDRIAGLLAAVSAGAWFDFFLTEPYQRFTINGPDDVEVVVILVVIGVAVSEVALWGRREQRRASVRAGYLEGVMQASQAIALHDAPSATLADGVAAQIRSILDAGECRFAAGPFHDTRYAVLEHDGSLVRRGVRRDDRDGLPVHEETVIPVRDNGVVLGHFVVTAATRRARPTLEQRRVAVLLADQLGQALRRPQPDRTWSRQ